MVSAVEEKRAEKRSALLSDCGDAYLSTRLRDAELEQTSLTLNGLAIAPDSMSYARIVPDAWRDEYYITGGYGDNDSGYCYVRLTPEEYTARRAQSGIGDR